MRAVEIKLSQGAEPGLADVLPAAKITPEIARSRGIPRGRDYISANGHTAFRDADSMLDFVEPLASETGLPVGIKSAVGEMRFWRELARLTRDTSQGVDFIVIDGGEGGTRAAPLTLANHVSLPFRLGFPRAHRVCADADLHKDILFVGSGRLGLPDSALHAIGMGCDLINVGREAMPSIGCIQAQRRHTNWCPIGVAASKPWRMRGLDPAGKAHRAANYIVARRQESTLLSRACGVQHPSIVGPDHIELLTGGLESRSLRNVLGYEPDWGSHAPGEPGLAKHA